jgi:hypothetical protein
LQGLKIFYPTLLALAAAPRRCSFQNADKPDRHRLLYQRRRHDFAAEDL